MVGTGPPRNHCGPIRTAFAPAGQLPYVAGIGIFLGLLLVYTALRLAQQEVVGVEVQLTELDVVEYDIAVMTGVILGNDKHIAVVLMCCRLQRLQAGELVMIDFDQVL